MYRILIVDDERIERNGIAMLLKQMKYEYEIAEASNYQATAIAQIDKAVDQVSQVVQTNSATSEECADNTPSKMKVPTG